MSRIGEYHVSDAVAELNKELVNETAMPTVTPSKYHNVRTEVRGMTFSSGHEAKVINDLILAEKQHALFALRLQVAFPLPGGVVYRADAVYLDSGLVPHVVDAKGKKTEGYKIKAKLFKETYGREIEEV